MELSLLGAAVLLCLFNPLVLVHIYDFWLCSRERGLSFYA